MEYNFNDKVVMVTGASSGIGAQIALDFARHGAKLALAGRNETNLQTTVAKCVEAGQSLENIYTFIGDLQEEEEINRLIVGTVDKFGSIHILVNNAGSYDRGNIESSSVAGLDSMYNIHVRSVFLLTQRALPKLLETKGNIVNLSAVCGKRPVSEYEAGYAAQNCQDPSFLRVDQARFYLKCQRRP